MSRKKLKNRRRKDRAQRKILIAAVCIAAVIIGVGIGGHVIKKNAGKTMTTAETESKKAVSKKKATAKKLTINENETDASNKENQGQKDQADDRSEFAVQPGRKVGTTEQSDEKVVYLTLDDGPSKNTQEVQARGYQYYDWNGSSGDGAVRTTEQLVDQATSFHDNNIILLSHDSETKDTTVEALPKIIEYYQSQGYVFKALDLNLSLIHI